MDDLIEQQDQLQSEAENLLKETLLLEFLSKLGKPIRTGSSTTGLMVYPDIDFSVQNDSYNVQDALSLTNALFETLEITSLKIADFSRDDSEGAGYYIGFELPFKGKTWHIDATISKVGPIITSPPEMQNWIDAMTNDERVTVLNLKKQLIDTKRYAGAHSQPPYTFRSSHVYEGVQKGGAHTIIELENYFLKS